MLDRRVVLFWDLKAELATLGFDGGVTMLKVLSVELFIEQARPPPIDRTALALSMKDKSSLSLQRARNRSVPFCPPKGSRVAESSSALKANSLFLKRYNIPSPLMFMRASLLVFRLVSIKAANRSVNTFFTNSFGELVTRDSEAKERIDSSAFEVD